MKTFSKRVWLNRNDSGSTGSVVAFCGDVKWKPGKPEISTFLEVSDCHSKVRLHRAYLDSREDFIAKMLLLRDTVDQFIKFLEEETSDRL